MVNGLAIQPLSLDILWIHKMKRLFWAFSLLILICAELQACKRDATIFPKKQLKAQENLNPLLSAVKEGNLAAVRKLLAKGADVNASDANGLTPLMAAISGGNSEIVQVLSSAGADVNARTVDGYTALHVAAVDREIHIVERLIALGADVNARTRNNVTPLMCSIGSPHGDPKISLVLLKAGAD